MTGDVEKYISPRIMALLPEEKQKELKEAVYRAQTDAMGVTINTFGHYSNPLTVALGLATLTEDEREPSDHNIIKTEADRYTAFIAQLVKLTNYKTKIINGQKILDFGQES